MQVVDAVERNIYDSLLRSPGFLEPLLSVAGNEFRTEAGACYPLIDGIVCLIPEEERSRDLGDAKFYEEHPFGVRDWSNREEVEAGVEREIKEVLERVPKDALIADIGCGSGRVSNYMSHQGYTNVLSLDYSLNSLRMVAENTGNYCVWGNNLSIPLASDSFDLVISTGVIHHTPDPPKAFAECCRIVKPGGLLFVKMRNLHSPYGYLFHTYGAALRFCERRPALKWVSDLFGFQVYRATRKVFYSSLPKRPVKELRGKFENLFVKNLITFFTTAQVERMLAQHHMEVQYGWKTSMTHRQHFYVAKKVSAAS
ncbi:MAG TPA: class I SAM-dependent methyltransferase [Rhodothermales bacterium]|nr:class I SAM-dependent methyltransferase [Rhodothermales bacterium]